MNKSDLKTGMLLELSNGQLSIVLLDTPNGDWCAGNKNFSGTGYFKLDYLTEDLKVSLSHHTTKEVVVTKVYLPSYSNTFLSFNIHDYSLYWERK